MEVLVQMKYVIVGASHGGHEAALELLTQDKSADVTIIEAGDFVSFMSCGMELFLTDKVKDPTTVRNFKPADLEELGGKVLNNTKAVEIDGDNHKIKIRNLITSQDSFLNYDKLIISSGVNPVKLPIPGNDLDNIFLMRGYDWALKIKEKIEDPSVKNVTIIGAGYIGVEAMESFLRAGKKVTIIDTLPRVLGAYLDAEMTDKITDQLIKLGVKIRTGEHVQSFQGVGNKVSTVFTDKGSYTTDLVIEAIGVKPNTDWLKNSINLDQRGWIETDPYLQTNLPDVYAIGDAILPFSIPANKPLPIALATTARREAQYVVQTLNGLANKRPFKGVVGTSALSVAGYGFATAGLNATTASRANIDINTSFYADQRRPYYVPNASGNGEIMVSLSYNPDTHVILGGSVMAPNYDVTQLGSVLSLAISQKLMLEDLAEADFFFQPGFDRQWNVLNLAAQHALGYSEFTK